MSKTAIAALLIATTSTGCFVGSTPAAKRTGIAANGAAMAAGTGMMIASVQRAERSEKGTLFLSGLALATFAIAGLAINASVETRLPQPEPSPAPITGQIAVPGLAPVTLSAAH